MNYNKYIDLLLENYDLKTLGSIPEKKIDTFMDIKVTFHGYNGKVLKKTVRIIYIPEDVVPSKVEKSDWKNPAISFYIKDEYDYALNGWYIKGSFKTMTGMTLYYPKEEVTATIRGKPLEKIKEWAINLAEKNVWTDYKQASMF